MHPEWVSDFGAFAEFVSTQLGERPAGKSIDRVENDLGYLPYQPNGELQLCWSDREEQNNNRRGYKGKAKNRWGIWKVGDVEGSLFKVCKHYGVFDAAVKNLVKSNHLRPGMTVQDALTKTLSRNMDEVPSIECIQEPVEQPDRTA